MPAPTVSKVPFAGFCGHAGTIECLVPSDPRLPGQQSRGFWWQTACPGCGYCPALCGCQNQTGEKVQLAGEGVQPNRRGGTAQKKKGYSWQEKGCGWQERRLARAIILVMLRVWAWR